MRTVGDIIYTEKESSTGKLAFVWFALLVLLAITWRVAYTDLGAFNLVIAMAVAMTKCAFVLWYYMDLRSSPKIVVMFFGMGLVMLFISALLTMTDYVTRGHV